MALFRVSIAVKARMFQHRTFIIINNIYIFQMCPQFKHLTIPCLLERPPKIAPAPPNAAPPIIALPTLKFLVE